ncbi:phosphoribosylglycinamide formyltransferase [candidate division KSB1 bacterium]|jgi:phosphoribosylglycinamide formyltransferase-1|nr:phosphoribosylglycinamide formyltransferase [candidate division KSB1 bacterium]
MPKLNIAVFVSGRGSNLDSIFGQIKTGRLNASIALVISNRSDAPALDLARSQGAKAIHLAPNQFDDEPAYQETLLNLLQTENIDLVVLAGYLKKIPAAVVNQYKHKMINIHPALLPAFGGKGLYGRYVHEAVLEFGAKISGATVHFVDTEYDTGPPIVQECVPVLDDDTPESLAKRILEVEHRILPQAIEYFCNNQLDVKGRRVYIKKK